MLQENSVLVLQGIKVDSAGNVPFRFRTELKGEDHDPDPALRLIANTIQ